MTRSADVLHNFELERSLASRLRLASREQRRSLYPVVYDEYFAGARSVCHTIDDARAIARQVRLATRFLPPGGRYLEVGGGTCRVAAQIALSAHATVIEVSRKVLPAVPGVEVVLSDGVTLPVPSGSADLVYSNQLMEHLHPEDAVEQLGNVYKALVPGGTYMCITPNRLTGPHDVSKHFTTGDALGFHLREYTISELRELMLRIGFEDVRIVVALGGEVLAVLPGRVYAMVERCVSVLPRRFRRGRLARKLLDPGAVIAIR